MNKKGFTLIELIAVIVVLSLILLITVPIVNGIIEDGRKESFRNNVLNLFDAVKKLESQGKYKLDKEGILANDSRLNISNNPFVGGKIYLNEGSTYAEWVTDGRYCATGNKTTFIIDNYDPVDGCKTDYFENIIISQTPDNSKWSTGKIITITNNNENELISYSFNVIDEKNRTIEDANKTLNAEETIRFGCKETSDWCNSNNASHKVNEDKANIVIFAIKGNEIVATKTYPIMMVDSTKPTDVKLTSGPKTATSLTVVASAKEEDSYITGYSYKIEKEGTSNDNWSDYQDRNVVTFDGLELNSKYIISLKVKNASGKVSTTSRNFYTSNINPTKVEYDKSTWKNKKEVKIFFPMDRDNIKDTEKNNYVYKYSFIKSTETVGDWVTITPSECEVVKEANDERYCKITRTITNNGTIYTEVIVNGIKEEPNNSFKIENIDSTAPEVTTGYYVSKNEIRVHIFGKDEGGSELVTPYECYITKNGKEEEIEAIHEKETVKDENGNEKEKLSSHGICSFTGLTEEKDYKIDIEVKDNAGNKKPKNLTISTKGAIPECDPTGDTSTCAISFKETTLSSGYKTVKITYRYWVGDKAKYQYQLVEPQSNGEPGNIDDSKWITLTSGQEITTETITKHNTQLIARILDDKDQLVGDPVSRPIIIDITPPSCTWSGPTGTMVNGYIKKDQTLTYTLKCTDDYKTFKDALIWKTADGTELNEIESSNTKVATIENVTRTALTSGNGYQWDVTVKAGATTGNATFTLVAGAVKDTVGNKNVAVTSAKTKVDNTAPTCGTTSQSSKSTSVTGSVNCSDDHSGCVKTKYSASYTSNGTKTITIADNLGNTRGCSVTISNVVFLPTISWVGYGTSTDNSICCNARCKSGGKCNYAQWNVDAKGGTISGSSYMRGTISGVGTYYRYYAETSINGFGALWGSSSWYIARSNSFNTAMGKICTDVGCTGEV